MSCTENQSRRFFFTIAIAVFAQKKIAKNKMRGRIYCRRISRSQLRSPKLISVYLYDFILLIRDAHFLSLSDYICMYTYIYISLSPISSKIEAQYSKCGAMIVLYTRILVHVLNLALILLKKPIFLLLSWLRSLYIYGITCDINV